MSEVTAAPGEARKQLGVLVDADLRVAIEARAARVRETVSVVVRRALREAFAEELAPPREEPPPAADPPAGSGDSGGEPS